MPSKSADDFDEPLMSGESDSTEDLEMSPGGELRTTHFPRRRGILKFQGRVPWMSLIPWTLFLGLSLWVLHQYQKRGPNNPIFPQMLYSPAQDALEYEVRKFRLGLDGDTTEFQGQPSPELDKNWSNLYDMGINLIPRGMAAKLPNKTIIFPHDEQRRYLVELDVFHQLHCLNMIRQALHPEYYKPHTPGPHPGEEDELLGHDHVDHCVDAIRQSLMCNADISVLTWRWNRKQKKNMEMGTILHTCRRFDKIQDWARKHAVYHNMDNEHREMNDPLDPDTWVDGFSG
ncbi:hypothetical protein B0T19DRAFT_435447 [Cercophora scortea]|uniref:Tat pathway signal sequence n=1 Tax=Cercophora scortea TaxID=314031 RepID=A0AAE0I368_9PEZI|nr:hypothetical protein B0T19DRAFT_435447 [Cercophora scortea]